MILKGKTVFVYDVEVFPNFFSCATKNTESGNIKVFEISEWQNDIVEIAKLFLNKKIYFCGYNTIHYDAPLISYIIINLNELCKLPIWEVTKKLKDFSDLIITSKTSASWSKYKYANLFPQLDLLTMMFAQKLRVGLKSIQVTMEYDNVEEYDGDFNSPLPKNDREKLIAYNINDILSTEALMQRLVKDINLRVDIEKTLNVDVLNQDGVNLGVEVIKANYLKDSNKTWNDIKDLRSPCDELDLKDVIFDFISFKTSEFQKLHKEILATHLNLKEEKEKNTTDRWKKTVFINDLEITYSLGGIHTRNKPEIYRSNEEWVIIDSDCALILAHVKSLKLRERP